MTQQHPLTLVVPVKADRLQQLTTLLEITRADLAKAGPKPFEATGTIHYARLLLLTPESNAKFPVTTFVLSTDYDGDEDQHLTDLSTKMTDLIDRLYDCCEGYPPDDQRNPDTRKSFLKSIRTKTDAFYAGAPGRSLKQIQQESTLRNYIWDMLKEPVWSGKTAVEVHKEIRTKVLSQNEFEWVKERIVLSKNKWWVIYTASAALLILALLYHWIFIAIAIVVGVLVGWIIMLHFFFELNDKPLGLTPSRINEAHLQVLEEYEDLHNQNQFSQLIPMKPGRVRTITLNALMIYAKIKILLEFEEGKLMGIPTIHFARWLRVDNGKQMLFFSNFDGSWQQYLGDFIDKSGWGLTAIFSNTENFPVTKYLFTGGAYDEEHFLAWSRYYQIPTQVWYCAYPKLSIKNVNNNTYIRHELVRELGESEAQKFLNSF